ncbi:MULTISPECIES: hypothetical protein [Pseudofrankia]|uniref:hypothetical protein n=1 Tax=Pseudofrankia TaxID=2994363 RepID=UPI000234B2AE|nr:MULTISPECIES: hypothetical protein [Pseudofrankia]OHV29718.1 hypothetical protein BCD49_35920 [Pseudofrankia sp. EUN1h]
MTEAQGDAAGDGDDHRASDRPGEGEIPPDRRGSDRGDRIATVVVAVWIVVAVVLVLIGLFRYSAAEDDVRDAADAAARAAAETTTRSEATAAAESTARRLLADSDCDDGTATVSTVIYPPQSDFAAGRGYEPRDLGELGLLVVTVSCEQDGNMVLAEGEAPSH